MRIAVCIKEVIDARLPLQVEASSGTVTPPSPETQPILNPADRSAIEIAMRLKEQIDGARVEAFSVCGSDGQEALCYARARGVDRVERLSIPFAGAPYTAAALALRFRSDHFDLICCGDETLDNSSAIVGPLLAELLDLPQVTSIVQVRECSERAIVVERGLEQGHRELVEMQLPGLLTLRVDSAAPQYVSYRRLEQARRIDIPVQKIELRFANQDTLIWPERVKITPPRARVRKAFTPDAKLSPADRIRAIMSGGLDLSDAKGSIPILEGEPEYLAEQIFRFLKHHEFV